MNTRPPVPACAVPGVLPGPKDLAGPAHLLPARCCFPAARAVPRLYSLAAAMNRPAGLPEEAR